MSYPTSDKTVSVKTTRPIPPQRFSPRALPGSVLGPCERPDQRAPLKANASRGRTGSATLQASPDPAWNAARGLEPPPVCCCAGGGAFGAAAFRDRIRGQPRRKKPPTRDGAVLLAGKRTLSTAKAVQYEMVQSLFVSPSRRSSAFAEKTL